jgi:Bacterial PH domain
MSDHDFERADGLPGPLPEGERLLWQGRPDWKSLAVQAFHVRKIAGYFTAVAMAQAALKLSADASLVDASLMLGMMMLAGCAAIAILCLLAYLSARTTIYSLTSKRIVMKIGIALSVSFNIPFTQIDGASVGIASDGTGNLCFRLKSGSKLAYLLIWPHAKPWHLSKPEPTFRAIADAEAVADLTAKALGTSPAVEAMLPESRVPVMLAAAE